MQEKNFVFTTPLRNPNAQQPQAPLIQAANAQNGGHVVVGVNLQNDFAPVAQPVLGANIAAAIAVITPPHVGGGALLINQIPVAAIFITPPAHHNLQIAPGAPLPHQANQTDISPAPQSNFANLLSENGINHAGAGAGASSWSPSNSTADELDGIAIEAEEPSDLDLSEIGHNSEDESDNGNGDVAMHSNLYRALHHHQEAGFNDAMLNEGFYVEDSDPETSRGSDDSSNLSGTKRSHDEIDSDGDIDYEAFDSMLDDYTESDTSAASAGNGFAIAVAAPTTPISATPDARIALGTIDRAAMREAVTPVTRSKLARIFEGEEEVTEDESVENDALSNSQDREITTSDLDQDLAGETSNFDLGFDFSEI